MRDLPPRILCVDDESRILEGLVLNLEWDYRVETTTSGHSALEMLQRAQDEGEPYVVIISDMRMPIMDGATLLQKARVSFPDTTRLLLTGYSDIESAILAVNQGSIFRFLSKPCEEDVLLGAVADAVRQNQLINSERELLDETLKGAAKALTTTLSLTSPLVFSRSSMITGYVRHLLEKLELEDRWMYELASMFVFIGFVAVPNETAHKYITGQKLSGAEQEMLNNCPRIAAGMLKEIPRFGLISQMITHHTNPQRAPSDPPSVELGARILQTCLFFDKLILNGMTPEQASVQLSVNLPDPKYQLPILLRDYKVTRTFNKHSAYVHELCEYMRLEEDVMTNQGQLVLPKGGELSPVTIQRIRNFDKNIGIRQPILVTIN